MTSTDSPSTTEAPPPTSDSTATPRPDSVGGRRGLAVVACGASCLAGVAAVAVLCWTVQTAATLPDRLVTDAPWLVSRAMAALECAMAVVFLYIPIRRVHRAVRCRHAVTSFGGNDIVSPLLRELNGRWAWRSRLSLTVPATAAAVELALRGRPIAVALMVGTVAVVALDLAAVAVHTARRAHHRSRRHRPPAISP